MIRKFNSVNFITLIPKFQKIKDKLQKSAEDLYKLVEEMESNADKLQSEAKNNEDYNITAKYKKMTAVCKTLATHVKMYANATSGVLKTGMINANKNLMSMNKIRRSFFGGKGVVNPQDFHSVKDINAL